MNITALMSAWPIPDPRLVASLTRGANNTVFQIDSGDGQYALRIYRNHADATRLDVEYQILIALQSVGLPFAIPAPVATIDGRFYTYFSDDEYGRQIAALFPWAPGDHPQRQDSAAAFAAAVALGQLDRALSALSLPQNKLLAPLGDFTRRYPSLGNPTETLTTLTGDSAAIDRIVGMYRNLNDELPALYSMLLCQMVHSDFDPSNVLMDATRVTAVLDFEFCTYDLRLLDLAVALSWWPIEMLGSGQEWPLINALGTGYASQVQLTDGEIDALPTVLEMRSIGSLLHRLERYRQGLDSADFLRRRIAQTLWRDDWLVANRARLLELAAGWREA